MSNGLPVHPCRICDGEVQCVLDLGRQPVSNTFIRPEDAGGETFYELKLGICSSCAMVQQSQELRRDLMFRADYPFRSSLSESMRKHFSDCAEYLLDNELTGTDPFLVEIGSNDGIMLERVSAAGVRHLGVDPSIDAAAVAKDKGVRTCGEFFDERLAASILAQDGPADVVFSANTFSHISYIGSVLRGVRELLAPNGVFIFEERYLGDIVTKNSFDQIYDEHFYLFTASSVSAMAELFGFELVDLRRLDVHGGSIRYTIAKKNARAVSAAVTDLLAEERERGLNRPETLAAFGNRINRIRAEFVGLLEQLRAQGRTVVGYGATARSATVLNYSGVGTDLIPVVYDTTVEKHGRLTPGSRIPIRPASEFTEPYPDYAVLFVWNYADEVITRERRFRDQGGHWIVYVPDVHII